MHATCAPTMNDQTPPNPIVPPVLVIPCSPALDGRARRLQCRQHADQCRGDEREQQRIRKGGRLSVKSTEMAACPR